VSSAGLLMAHMAGPAALGAAARTALLAASHQHKQQQLLLPLLLLGAVRLQQLLCRKPSKPLLRL
jgi:hypothetical protein